MKLKQLLHSSYAARRTIEYWNSEDEGFRWHRSRTIPTSPKVPSGMPSSNVAGMQYDDKSQNLWVQFLGKYPNRSGPVYQYGHVPKVIAELLQSGAIPARTDGKNKWGQWWKGKVPSAGASVYTLLKNQSYPYQKLS